MKKSTEELTGLTAQETKIFNLLQNIYNYNQDNIIDNFKVRITRHDLRTIISGTLDIINSNTISNYINLLVFKSFICQNPNSHTMLVKKG